MLSTLALLLCLAGVAVGFYLERKDRRADVSSAAWLAWLWVTICASRSVSQWLGMQGLGGSSSGDSLDGSPIDRMVLGAVIACGVFVICRRRGTMAKLVRSNKALLVFVLYLGVSALWSDIGAVSVRRWFRLLGHAVAAGVLASEAAPAESLRSVLRRCAYLLIPVSVLLIKFYPDLGVMYTREGGRFWIGAAIYKNNLAVLALVFCFTIIWSQVTASRQIDGDRRRVIAIFDLAIVLLGAWLLRAEGYNNSAAATACMVLVLAILALSRVPLARRAVRSAGAVLMLSGALFFALQFLFGVLEPVVDSLGRNMTFTDRVPVWTALIPMGMRQAVHGYGYGGFWTAERSAEIAAETIDVTDAHNGFLEVFLQGGAIALVLLGFVLVAVVRSIQRSAGTFYDYSVFRLCALVMVLLINVTESAFARERDLMSIIFFLIAMNDGVPVATTGQTSVQQGTRELPKSLRPGLRWQRSCRESDQTSTMRRPAERSGCEKSPERRHQSFRLS
jgi:O-antigen ligase